MTSVAVCHPSSHLRQIIAISTAVIQRRRTVSALMLLAEEEVLHLLGADDVLVGEDGEEQAAVTPSSHHLQEAFQARLDDLLCPLRVSYSQSARSRPIATARTRLIKGKLAVWETHKTARGRYIGTYHHSGIADLHRDLLLH